MATFGLKAALNIPKVNTGNASRYESQRSLDSQQLVCPPPTQYDNAGRPELPYSGFSTRTAGCYSALDQTMNESNLRPQFSELVTLNPQAYRGAPPKRENYEDAENYEEPAEYYENEPKEYFDVLSKIGGVAGYGQQLSSQLQSRGSEDQRNIQAYSAAQRAMNARINSGNY